LNEASTSAPVTEVVNAASATAVSSSANPVRKKATVTFTASITVNPASVAATGSVSFYDGSSLLGRVSVSKDKASLSTSSLSVGTHTITAVYGGAGNVTGCSGQLSEVVKS
jgi:hypothetical protein